MSTLKLNDVRSVPLLLRAGRRIDAADIAENYVKDKDEVIRSLVNALANEIRQFGDAHKKSGRPKRKRADKQILKLNLAVFHYHTAVACRNLVDGNLFSSLELARLLLRLEAKPRGQELHYLSPDEPLLSYQELVNSIGADIAFDIEGTRTRLMPLARDWLRKWNLSEKKIKRRGFKSETKKRISEIYGVSLHVIQRKLSR